MWHFSYLADKRRWWMALRRERRKRTVKICFRMVVKHNVRFKRLSFLAARNWLKEERCWFYQCKTRNTDQIGLKFGTYLNELFALNPPAFAIMHYAFGCVWSHIYICENGWGCTVIHHNTPKRFWPEFRCCDCRGANQLIHARCVDVGLSVSSGSFGQRLF